MMDQNHEVPQQLVTKPPIPSSDFTLLGSTSKVNGEHLLYDFNLFLLISFGII
jgi:hypothetical protein